MVTAPIRLDGATLRSIAKGERVPPHLLPEPARGQLDETVRLPMPIGEIEDLARDRGEPTVRLSLPGGATLAALMNHELGDPTRQVQELYWDVSRVELRDVVDQVRTTLTVLVAELLATMPDDQDLPSPEAAEQAVNVAVYGARPTVNVQTVQATSAATAP